MQVTTVHAVASLALLVASRRRGARAARGGPGAAAMLDGIVDGTCARPVPPAVELHRAALAVSLWTHRTMQGYKQAT